MPPWVLIGCGLLSIATGKAGLSGNRWHWLLTGRMGLWQTPAGYRFVIRLGVVFIVVGIVWGLVLLAGS